MQHRYRWRLLTPGDRLSVEMSSEEEGQEAFRASLTLKRRALTRVGLLRMALRLPLMSARALTLIYWQALCLSLRKAPFFEHPGRVRAEASEGEQ